MKNIINNKNNYMTVFTLSLILYFSAFFLLILCQSANLSGDNIFFGLDCYRNNYLYAHPLNRIELHPLFPVFIYPFILLAKLSANNVSQSFMIAFSSVIIQAINVTLFYRMLKKNVKKSYIVNIFTILYAFLFTNIIHGVVPETFVYASMFYLLMINYVDYLFKTNKELNNNDVYIFAGLGILSLGITISNIAPFELILMYVLFNKYLSDKREGFKKFLTVNILIVIGFLVLFLSLNLLFNINILKELHYKLTHPDGIISYATNSFSVKNFIVQFFVTPIAGPVVDSVGRYYSVASATIWKTVLLIPCIYAFIKEIATPNKKHIENILIIIFGFNFIFHIFYGANECFIYSQHYIHALFLLIAFGISKIDVDKKWLIAYLIIIIISNMSSVIQITIEYFNKFALNQNLITDYALYSLFALLIIILVFIKVDIKNRKDLIKYFVYLSLFVSMMFAVFTKFAFVLYHEVDRNSQYYEDYSEINGLRQYKFKDDSDYLNYSNGTIFISGTYQPVYISYVSEIKIKFDEENQIMNISAFIDGNIVESTLKYNKDLNQYIFNDGKTEKIINKKKPYEYIFGMGLRNKYILFKNENDMYSLKDMNTEEELFSNIKITHADEYNYKFKGAIDGKIFEIIEDEKEIYVIHNGKKIVLDNTQIINIPEYEEKDILKKKLLHEIMVNITKDDIYPNILTYDKTFYRDAAMTGMVLKETGNISQIEEWIKNMNSIYDKANAGMMEADNLGNVLYLQSLIEDKNEDLINEVLTEARKLKNKAGYIDGYTDFGKHPIYQTAWLKFGMESLGMDSSEFKIPYEIEDSYASLLWFYDGLDKDKVKVNETNVSYLYPYLTIAEKHFKEEPIEISKDYKGYLSHEYQGSEAKFYNNNLPMKKDFKIASPHIWTAVELYFWNQTK